MLDDPRVNFAISTRGRDPASITSGFRSRSRELKEVYARLEAAGRPSLRRKAKPCAATPSPRSRGSMIRLGSLGKPS